MSEDKKQEILKFYGMILKAVGADVSEKGLVSVHTDDGLRPFTAGEKRLVLPTDEILRHADWERVQPFHPLCEHTTLAESVVLKRLRFLVTYRINEIATVVAAELMRIAADHQQHKYLPPKCSEFLTQMSMADSKTLNAFYSVLSKASPTSTDPMVNIFMKRSAKLSGFSYTRAAIVNFPLLELIDEEVGTDTDLKVIRGNAVNSEITLLGIKMRKTDREAIINLLRWMFPGYTKPDTYSVGSSAITAPFFQSLLRAFIKVVNHLQGITDDFKTVINKDFEKELTVDMSWVPYIDNLDQFRDHIPNLDGNEGERRPDQKDMPINAGRVVEHEEITPQRPKLRREGDSFRETHRPSQQPARTSEPAKVDNDRPKYGEYNRMPSSTSSAAEDDWEQYLIKREAQQARYPNYPPNGSADSRYGYQQPPVQYAPNGRPIHPAPAPQGAYLDPRMAYGGYQQQPPPHYQYNQQPPPQGGGHYPAPYNPAYPQPGYDPYGSNMPRFRGASTAARR